MWLVLTRLSVSMQNCQVSVHEYSLAFEFLEADYPVEKASDGVRLMSTTLTVD